MPSKRRFTVTEHWSCEKCAGDGHVYEDAREQRRYAAQRMPLRLRLHPRVEGAAAVIVGGDDMASSHFHSERVACPACKGMGQRQREVSLEDALKELGVLPGFGTTRMKRPDI